MEPDANDLADREAADPFDEAEESLRKQGVRRALDALPERERRILELRYVRGCTQAEIGTEIGVTQTQVSRQLSSLVERLRLVAQTGSPSSAA